MKQREILLLSLSVFVIIVFWIGFSVYHNLATSQIPETTAERIEPISGTFDRQTIENLKNKEQVEPIFETQISTESAVEQPIPEESSPISTEDEESIFESTNSGNLEFSQ